MTLHPRTYGLERGVLVEEVELAPPKYAPRGGPAGTYRASGYISPGWRRHHRQRRRLSVRDGLVARTAVTAVVSKERAERLLAPRDDLVLEHETSPGCFTGQEGPFDRYSREITVSELADGQAEVHQVVEFDLAIPWFRWLFVLPVRHYLGRLEPDAPIPHWLAPVRLDHRSTITLSALCAIGLINGYLGTLLGQTITYAGRQFHAGVAPQNVALAAIRVEAVLAILMLSLADRLGRRRIILAGTAAGCVATALGALAPSLAWLTASQVLARGCTNAVIVLLVVAAAEEVPAGARAYSVSLLAAVSALGAGICVVSLGVAGLSQSSWRILFAAGLLGLLALPSIASRLVESRRFSAPHEPAKIEGHGGRLWLLIASALLLQIFFAPLGQDRNQFLRTARGFTATHISLFTVATGIPGGIGLVVGGRLADVHGRRVVAATALIGGSLASLGVYLVSGWLMWIFAVIATVLMAATIPSLGVYGPELFPTGVRGRANGIITMAGRVGSVIGLLAVAGLSGPLHGISRPLALLAAMPLIVGVLVMARYPETAQVELETINPEDCAPGAPDEPSSKEEP